MSACFSSEHHDSLMAFAREDEVGEDKRGVSGHGGLCGIPGRAGLIYEPRARVVLQTRPDRISLDAS